MPVAIPTETSRPSTPPAARSLDGVLNVHKPEGWTSHDVVKRIRSVFGLKKVGHAGTLDPHATGVLPVLLGKGTKVAEYLFSWDKEYVATMCFGRNTDTQDAWGTVTEEFAVESLSEEATYRAFSSFCGPIRQVPPMYSAVKIGGQPLYKRARKGEIINRPAKTVTIHDLSVQSMDLPEVTFQVVCSKGTYVRTLCEDLGGYLGVGGHLTRLRRNRVGPLKVTDAVNVEVLKKGLEFSWFHGAFWTLDQILYQIPSVKVQGDNVRKVRNGNALTWGSFTIEESGDSPENLEGTRVRVKGEGGELLALGEITLKSVAAAAPMLSINTVLES